MEKRVHGYWTQFNPRVLVAGYRQAVPDHLLLVAVCLFTVFTGTGYAQSIHSFNSGMNCYGVWKLSDTGQTNYYTIGDDSVYQPAVIQSSYTVIPVDSAYVTLDNVTGLMWIKAPADAGMGDPSDWGSALAACEGLDYAGFSDWRLPNVRELMSIVNYGAAIDEYGSYINSDEYFSAMNDTYWSSTTYIGPINDVTGNNAWGVNFIDGTVTPGDKSTSHYARCVRGGP
ncbi:MAG: DUF1566 domain-containing protein [Elusimicrobia bacterium]|nr:DUF1566 domain-containing protein [Elusimicrobiota bacterium]